MEIKSIAETDLGIQVIINHQVFDDDFDKDSEELRYRTKRLDVTKPRFKAVGKQVKQMLEGELSKSLDNLELTDLRERRIHWNWIERQYSFANIHAFT